MRPATVERLRSQVKAWAAPPVPRPVGGRVGLVVVKFGDMVVWYEVGWGGMSRLTEIRERAEEPSSDDRNVRHTLPVRPAEELRQLAISRHSHDDTRADPAVRVASRPC